VAAQNLDFVVLADRHGPTKHTTLETNARHTSKR
jgi:hypothetical protein